MSTNQGPEYFAAEKKYLEAQTADDRIYWLQEMIKNFKKHKGSERMLAELKNRLKKFKEKKERAKKSGKTTKKGIKKENFQCVLIGPPNSGKSSLLASLTNARPKITPYPFATSHPELGTMDYQGVKAQIVDLPSIGSENLDQGMINTADCLLILVENLSDLDKISTYLTKAQGSKIILINKSDLLSNEEQRKLEATIKSKKLPALLVSTITKQNIEQLKEKIFRQMHIIRIYTKEPGKQSTTIPIVLPENSKVKDVAESILKGFSQKIKETRLTGPSSKFPNQKVGLNHILEDKDIVEFHTQ